MAYLLCLIALVALVAPLVSDVKTLAVSCFTVVLLLAALSLSDCSEISVSKILEELEQMIYVLVWLKKEQRWVVRECSPGCAAIYGHSPEEMKSEAFNIMHHIHPEDALRIDQIPQLTFPIGHKMTFEKRARGRHPGSPYKWIRSKALLLFDDELEQGWLGMFDEISDLQCVCDELDRTRSLIAALDEVVHYCFTHTFYLDNHLNLSRSYWDFPGSFSGPQSIDDLIKSDADRGRFQKYILDSLANPERRRPVMVDLNLHLTSEDQASHSSVFAIRMPTHGGDTRILLGIRSSPSTRLGLLEVPRGVIDVEVNGDIESAAGFLYSSLPGTRREVFASLWRDMACLEDLLDYLNSFGPCNGDFFAVVTQLIVLSLLEQRAPSLDEVLLLSTCLERSLSMNGRRSSDLCFRISLCALKLPNVPATAAAFFFDKALQAVVRGRVSDNDALHKAAVLCVQRGVHSARCNREEEAVHFFEETLRFACPVDAEMMRIRALALYNSFVVRPTKTTLRHLGTLIDSGQVMDPVILLADT